MNLAGADAERDVDADKARRGGAAREEDPYDGETVRAARDST